MQDLPMVANFLGVCVSCMPQSSLYSASGLATRLPVVRGHVPQRDFLNGAIWCVLDHIITLKSSKNIHFLYNNNDKLGSSSCLGIPGMIHDDR